MDKLNFKTKDGIDVNLEKLSQLFPEAITETKDENGNIKRVANLDVLKTLLNGYVADPNDVECYEFTWPGKREAIMEAAKSTTKTLRPCPEESKNWDTTQNLYIEGDNLEVLKLLQESYLGKVKMIYIDPPYNTGKDFVYRDNFHKSAEESKEDEIERDEETNDNLFQNTESNGRFHSDWCSMIYPRLKLARDLLRDDGVAFISIDDKEVDNLRKICDEIFGEKNRLDRGQLIWINKGSTKGFNKIVKNHEYILAYGKNADFVSSVFGDNRGDELEGLEHYCYNKPSPKNPYNDILFKKGCRIEGVEDIEFENYVGDEVKLEIVSGKMVFKSGILQEDVVLRGTYPYKNQIEHYFANHDKGIPTYDFKGQQWIEIFFNKKGLPRYRKERNTQIISSIIDESGIPNYGSDDIASLLGKKEIFNFPKPHQLLMHLISYFADKDALILDFFSGSGTVAHSIFQMNAQYGGNRKFIMVQLPEVCAPESEASKAGYKNICEIGKERIRRAGEKIKAEHATTAPNLDIGFRVLKLDESNMKEVYYKPDELSQDMLSGLESNIKEDRNDLDLLYACLIDWGVELALPLKTEEINGVKVYTVNDSEIPDLIACFSENIPETTIREIAKRKPLRVVFRDSSFADSPSKINVTEIFKTLSPNTTIKVL